MNAHDFSIAFEHHFRYIISKAKGLDKNVGRFFIVYRIFIQCTTYTFVMSMFSCSSGTPHSVCTRWSVHGIMLTNIQLRFALNGGSHCVHGIFQNRSMFYHFVRWTRFLLLSICNETYININIKQNPTLNNSIRLRRINVVFNLFIIQCFRHVLSKDTYQMDFSYFTRTIRLLMPMLKLKVVRYHKEHSKEFHAQPITCIKCSPDYGCNIRLCHEPSCRFLSNE